MNRKVMKKCTIVMMASLALGCAAAQADDKKLVLDGSTTVGPIAKAFAELYMKQKPDVTITVSESGSGNGAKALLNGTCDIATLSRNLKDSEREAMVAKGIEPTAFVVAYDALPIIVHPSNKVKELTLEQLRDIYIGNITNWNQVGGLDGKIVVISRDTNSGTYETFKELVLKKDDKIIDKTEYVGSNGALRLRVQTTKGAIGYIGLGFVDKTVKPLSIEGVVPSMETVLDKSYKLSRELFMFTNGTPAKDSLVGKFLDLARSDKGREIISEIGFVPVP